ncbi:hypothetical protein MA16_Dca019224 [Dendrobium catenatum]|uniref:Uncharacterized protein n=1 Tax=Dendrobium catenatum TaxID=906689 RepID=A0A2I0W1N0_9ASPA|nr:hypothetical protein MA16_Dca019224 [Dendrobium catenatum]
MEGDRRDPGEPPTDPYTSHMIKSQGTARMAGTVFDTPPQAGKYRSIIPAR